VPNQRRGRRGSFSVKSDLDTDSYEYRDI
jgi:hypothetical protein